MTELENNSRAHLQPQLTGHPRTQDVTTQGVTSAEATGVGPTVLGLAFLQEEIKTKAHTEMIVRTKAEGHYKRSRGLRWGPGHDA